MLVAAGIPGAALPGGRTTAWAVRLLRLGGAAAVAIAWLQSSATVEVDRQVDWAAVGIAGVAAIGLASVLAFVAARQALAMRLHRLVSVVEAMPTATEPDVQPAHVVTPELPVAAPNMARYHRSSCPLARSKPVRADKHADHEAAGRRPCGVCEP